MERNGRTRSAGGKGGGREVAAQEDINGRVGVSACRHVGVCLQNIFEEKMGWKYSIGTLFCTAMEPPSYFISWVFFSRKTRFSSRVYFQSFGV